MILSRFVLSISSYRHTALLGRKYCGLPAQRLILNRRLKNGSSSTSSTNDFNDEERKAKRLIQDIQEEFRILNDFATTSRRRVDMEQELRDLAISRSHWPKDKKLTPEEEVIIERFFGMNSQEMVQGLVDKYGLNDEEQLEHRLRLLLTCKKLPTKMAINNLRSRKFLRDGYERILKSLPPKHVDHGFSDNASVLAKHADFAKSLDRFNTPLNLDKFWASTDLPIEAQRSPFGPVSSSACYEELALLRAVQLKDLFNYSGRVIPRTKILLTVVADALVSASKIVTTVVQDENGQCICLQIHNIENLVPTTAGLDAFPVGSRFYLKNPFLKVAQDSWLILRVDQPFDLERIDLPPLCGKILIVGDGDFSFSVALAKANKKRGSAEITASSLDSQKQVKEKYSSGLENLKTLSLDPRVMVLHEVDATKPGALGAEAFWDSVVWNFPYPPDQKVAIPSAGSSLLSAFFSNLKCSLKPNGRAYVTLAQRQGGSTREAAGSTLAWDVESLADGADLELVEALPFNIQDFDGYIPKRAYSDETFPFENSRMHVLRLREITLPGETPSERSPLSRISSFMIDQMAWGALPSHIHTPIDSTIKSLTPFVENSSVARRLLECAMKYKQVLDMLASNFDDESFLKISKDVCELLYFIFSTDDGELVIYAEGEERAVLARARICSRFTIIETISPFLTNDAVEELFSRADNASKFMISVRDFHRQIGDEMPLEKGYNETLGRAIFVAANMEFLMSNGKDAMAMLGIGCSMLPRDPFLHYCRAVVTGDCLSKDANKNEEQLRLLVSGDCYKVLDLIGNDKSHVLYQRSIYILAFVHQMTCEKQSWLLAISFYEHYIALAKSTDRQLAKAHYHVGLLKVANCFQDKNQDEMNQSIEKGRYHYQQGLEAEKSMLPFFGPVVMPTKQLLATLIMMKNQSRPSTTPDEVYPEKMKKERWCTAEQVSTLIKVNGGKLYMGHFKDQYKKHFHKEPFKPGTKVKKELESLAQSGLFKLENTIGDGKSYWILPKV